MSDSNRPDDVPDDLPPEYADAYRRGYQRAVDEETQAMPAPSRGEPAGGQPRQGAHRGPEADPGYDTQPWSAVDWGSGAQRAPAAEPEHTSRLNLNDVLAMQEAEAQAERYDAAPAYDDERERRKRSLYVPTLLVALAVLLLASAYVFGKIFSSEVTGRPTGGNTGNLVMKEHGGSGSSKNKPMSKHGKQRYDGPVNAAPIGAANASCQSPTSADAAGNAVEYNPENVYDGDMTTAWRCDGDGYGQRLSLALPQRAALGEVGLVPGYAKTDPYSHEDRYAENNRITKVQWSFSDGSSVVQRFDPSPSNREMQVMRIPVTRADRVTISILGSQPGPRNTVAVSEVTLGQVAR